MDNEGNIKYQANLLSIEEEIIKLEQELKEVQETYKKAIKEEMEKKNVIKLVDEVYSTFGLTYTVELSTMPESHIGEIEEWQMAETALANALKNNGLEYKVNEGDGAFYGPKIDIKMKDCLGREWQMGTVQVDFQLPQRFNLSYIDKDGNKKTPIMIHRAIFGSFDRFIGIITEHFAGAFPTWLAPVQVKILPISDKFNDYADEVKNKCNYKLSFSDMTFPHRTDLRSQKEQLRMPGV